METFAHKVKMENRLELSKRLQLSSSNQHTHPHFLSKDSLTTSNIPSSIDRPKTTTVGQISRITGGETSEAFLSTLRSSERDGFRFLKLDQPQFSSKRILRRRSCCCKWCGGLSNLEAKHKDVSIKKEFLPKQFDVKDYVTIKTKPNKKIPPMIDMNLDLDDEETGSGNEELSPLTIDMRERIRPRNYKLLTINTTGNMYASSTAGLEDSLKVSRNQSPVELARIPIAKILKSSSTDGFKLGNRRLKSPEMNEQGNLEEKSLKILRQGSFSPVKLHRDIGLSSIKAKQQELMKLESFSEIPQPASLVPNTTNTKWVASPANVLQKFCRDVSRFTPTSPDTIAKLSVPLSSTLVEKIKPRMKLEALPTVSIKESEVKIKESQTSNELNRKRIDLLNSETRRNHQREGSSEPQGQAIRKLKPRHHSRPKERVNVVGVHKEKRLREFKTRISTIYLEEKSNSTIYNKTMSRLKDISPIGKINFENDPLMGSKLDVSKISPTEVSKDQIDKEELNPEFRSPKVRKLKKKKDLKVKSKEDHLQWLFQTFSSPKKASLTLLPVIPASGLMKSPKKRRETKEETE